MVLREKFTPICFLSALGAGGLSVSFFIYLMFMIPHKGVAMTTFEFFYPALIKGDWLSFVAGVAALGIVFFAGLHFKLLVWNIKQYRLFKQSERYQTLLGSNAEVTLMTLPLTFTMTINVCFVLGALFVPGLWSVVEYLFPFALLGFAISGYFALKFFIDYFTRLIIKGDFDFTQNNSLSQMISIFAFAMVAVGFAAPGAMSHHLTINAIGIFCSIFFSAIALLLLLIKMIFGFQTMFEKGISAEASPSLWIMIPILTLLGITFVRISFGLDHHFDQKIANASMFTFTSFVVSLQIIFGLIGYKVMKSIGYFETYIASHTLSPSSFALICPGVAFMVFGMFFLHTGLVANNVVEQNSIAYFIVMMPFIFVQMKTIVYFFKLKKKFFS
ncbi:MULTISPECIES: hypothetical protein [Sulfurospirillum]|uniref:TsoY family (seleno)protein n=1 Tax=Sulfurospirillum TaxID=57665 RepID=UPI000764C618|nr:MULTISPECIES: hypothetical protein [Sulfurospirillum]MCP3651858.1 hypothetical protein [Sulfurospirillum sp. DNRA8]MCR1810705.1 hypothetical protein [Sulfurospirillum sp. DNRA8]